MSVKTSASEPDWPIVEGARIIEYSDVTAATVAPAPEVPPPPQLPPDLSDRYGNRYWDGEPLRGIA